MKKLILINYLLPLILKIVVPDGRFGVLTLWIDYIVLPLVLITINAYLFKNTNISIITSGLLLLSALTVSVFVGYIVWGMGAGRLLSPDGETVHLISILLKYYFIISLIFVTALGIYRKLCK